MRKLDIDERVIVIKTYNKAKEYEIIGKYKFAENLYRRNIEKYDDGKSKVELAKMYLNGKTRVIDNVKARELLESAKLDGIQAADSFLAYMYANGIGGAKNKEKAVKLFEKELNNNNPDVSVYYELSKLLPRKDKYKKIALKKSISNREIRKYKRKVSIDKFNNWGLGKVVNTVSNVFSRLTENFFYEHNEDKFKENIEVLFDRATECEYFGENGLARRIYQRLHNLGDRESKIKYAHMCMNGIGGEKDIQCAKEIYEDFIIKQNKAINNLSKKLDRVVAEKVSRNKKLSRSERKNLESKIEDAKILEERISKIENEPFAAEASLNYGIILTNYAKNKEEFARGIVFLKNLAYEGNNVPTPKCRLSELGRRKNALASKAIRQLGILYESGKWQPKDIEKERELFCKFTTGNISRYAGRISEMMKDGKKETYTRNLDGNIPVKMKKNKQLKGAFELGILCWSLGINKIARKCFTKMSEHGDYRCSSMLAELEERGKGGEENFSLAKKHYREYISANFDANTQEDLPGKNYVMYRLADLLEYENDYKGAIAYYKTSAKGNFLDSKLALRRLSREGLWKAETEADRNLIRLKGIQKVFGNIKEFFELRNSNYEEDYLEENIKPIINKKVVTSSVKATAAVTAAATSLLVSGNIVKDFIPRENSGNESWSISNFIDEYDK